MFDALAALETEDNASAASIPKPFRHPNAGLVAPLWQGEACVGLSGLYAVVNGIRLAVAHRQRLSAAEVDGLMRAGLRFLDGRLTPQQCVLNGLRVQLWRSLAEAMNARLFNFARCTVPFEYRDYAVPSISDWKRRFARACTDCSERDRCSGFFEWHPDPDSVGVTPL